MGLTCPCVTAVLMMTLFRVGPVPCQVFLSWEVESRSLPASPHREAAVFGSRRETGSCHQMGLVMWPWDCRELGAAWSHPGTSLSSCSPSGTFPPAGELGFGTWGKLG